MTNLEVEAEEAMLNDRMASDLYHGQQLDLQNWSRVEDLDLEEHNEDS